jgi:hypothetical protein
LYNAGRNRLPGIRVPEMLKLIIMNTKDFNVQELELHEMKEANGGFLALLVPYLTVVLASATAVGIGAAFYGAATKGYNDGHNS